MGLEKWQIRGRADGLLRLDLNRKRDVLMAARAELDEAAEVLQHKEDAVNNAQREVDEAQELLSTVAGALNDKYPASFGVKPEGLTFLERSQ